MSFWEHLPRPFFVMAPMADVTDPAFRALVAARGAPGVFWTEFVSADGLYHTREVAKLPDAENPLMRDLRFSEAERPIVAQLFGSSPETIAYAARLVAELGFDGVDLNMGCPDRSVEKQGAGAALIRAPEAARTLIRAAKTSGLPVSVKTRVGYNKESLDDWLPALLAETPAAVTLHLRTRKEMSLVHAKWELMAKAVAIRDRLAPRVKLIGNGDVTSVAEGKRLAAETGADGVMIGRGMFGNPWVFSEDEKYGRTRSIDEKLDALIELARGFEALTPPKNFSILKKHIKAFVTGFDGAAALRERLMAAETAADLERLVHSA
jgi:nifR3 family TIM-barrel protein